MEQPPPSLPSKTLSLIVSHHTVVVFNQYSSAVHSVSLLSLQLWSFVVVVVVVRRCDCDCGCGGGGGRCCVGLSQSSLFVRCLFVVVAVCCSLCLFVGLFRTSMCVTWMTPPEDTHSIIQPLSLPCTHSTSHSTDKVEFTASSGSSVSSQTLCTMCSRGLLNQSLIAAFVGIKKWSRAVESRMGSAQASWQRAGRQYSHCTTTHCSTTHNPPPQHHSPRPQPQPAI